MPNWCNNEVRIEFDDKKHAQKFIDECCVPWPDDMKLPSMHNPSDERPVYFSFKKTMPLDKLTKDGSDWDYGIAVDTWGTKWDIGPGDHEPLIPSEILNHLEVNMNFPTAWGPPEGIHQRLGEMGFDNIFWFYREDGVQLTGYL